jgi:cytochrome c-type biogenesis protein CcmH
MTGRRDFLRLAAAAGAALPLGATRGAAQGQDPAAPRLGGTGASGTLGDPSVVGRSRAPTTAKDNLAEIREVEQRLACTCGCTLDIYTCRTTDFTCTYSPELHREVVALHDAGKRGQEIVDAFVAKYGEKALMAPVARGFNLAGYLVPGAAITTAGALLGWIIARKRRVAAEPAGATAGIAGGAVAPPAGSPDEMARLERALREVED